MPSPIELHEIKHGIRTNHAMILEKWTNRVQSRPPNLSELLAYVADQHDLAGTEMMKLMIAVFSFLDYKSMHTFGKDFRDVARRIAEKLGGRKFYLIMDCGSEDEFTWQQSADVPKENKSNYFMFVLLMCIRPDLLDQLVDFVCMRGDTIIPVHTKLDEDVKVFVYMDDVAFTGTQASYNTAIDDPRYLQIIYASVYASEEAIDRLAHNLDIDYKSHSIITSDFRPRVVSKAVVTEKYLSSTTTPMGDDLINAALRSLGMLSHEEKYLFYTDLKIPDNLSMYKQILPQTRLIEPSGKFEGEYRDFNRYRPSVGPNLVGGGWYNFDSEIGRWYDIIDTSEQQEDPGSFFDDEVYKTKSWEASLRSLKKGMYCRKRNRDGDLIEASPHCW